MNIHVPLEIHKKYPNFTFRGKRFVRNNRTLIKAYHIGLGRMFYYSFDEDFFWLVNCEIPQWKVKNR